MSPKKNNDTKILVARHDERIQDLEKRAEERREADKQIFKGLEDINKNISSFREDFAGWKGRVAVGGTLAVLFLSAVVGALFRYVF